MRAVASTGSIPGAPIHAERPRGNGLVTRFLNALRAAPPAFIQVVETTSSGLASAESLASALTG